MDEDDFYYSDMTPEEQINYEKEMFTQEFGTEDKWTLIYEDEESKEEVNGASGEFRYTDKETGEIKLFNYFDELEQELAYYSMTDEEKLAYEKQLFHEEFGTEDKWTVFYEDDALKEEVNGATGDVRYTHKKTGEVEYDNYFKLIEEDLLYGLTSSEDEFTESEWQNYFDSMDDNEEYFFLEY